MSRKTDLAWAAGIVDGEGSISLYRAHTRTGDAYVLRLTVANTNLLMLERLREIFGCGAIIPQKRYEVRHKQRWNWQLVTRRAEEVIRLIEPYLVAKRDHARIALLSRKYIRQLGINTKNNDTEELERMRMQLSSMNAGRAIQ